MATVFGVSQWVSDRVVKITWGPLANGDVGAGESLSGFDNVTFQVKGTFGAGGSINMEGSNDSGTTYHILNDTRGEGNALTLTAADTRRINERPQQLRPNVTAGDGTTALTVVAICSVVP